jgi:PAS domain S-box-containing protein
MMGTPIRVLVVEDSEPETELLIRELQQGGFDPEYQIVDTAEATAAALDGQPWDVILADYVLPRFSGPDALRMVKDRGLDTPVIIISGRIDEEVLAAAMLAGARDCVLKNSPARLVPAVRREIADARRRHLYSEARRQAEEELRKAYDEMEKRVSERTAELLQANVMMSREIARREQAEEALRAARYEAERREAELRSFITSIADGVAIWDAAGQLVFLNDAARQVLGVPKDISLDQFSKSYELRTLEGESIPEEQWGSRRALRGEEVRDYRARIITPWKEAVISYSAAPVLDSTGRVIGATSVLRDVGERVEFEKQQRELFDREHRIAQMLQHALVPTATFIEVEGCRAALRYEPALEEAEVGGDFYDVFDLSEGRVGIVIGDVAGKGLDAAVYVAAAKHALRSYAYLFDSPADVMTSANEALCRTELDGEMEWSMLTVFFATVDPRKGTIRWANAGHEPPVIRHGDGSIEELEGTDIALGVLCGSRYREHSQSLGAEDVVVMVTDGITEARPSPTLVFGKAGVLRYLSEHPEVPFSEIPTGLLEAARTHGGGRLQDDAAIVVFQCGAESGE